MKKEIEVQSLAEMREAQPYTPTVWVSDSSTTSPGLQCTQSNLKQLQI